MLIYVLGLTGFFLVSLRRKKSHKFQAKKDLQFLLSISLTHYITQCVDSMVRAVSLRVMQVKFQLQGDNRVTREVLLRK